MRTLLEVNGKQLYVEIFGPEHAPVVLYLHGGPGASCYDFIYFQKALLETDLRVVAIDQRGVLRSEAIAEDEPFGMNDLVNDCEALRKELGIERWAVLGHSFGGQLGVYYTLAYPDAVNALILESPGLDMDCTLKSHLEKMAIEFLCEGKTEAAKHCWKLSVEEMTTKDKMHAFLQAKQPLGERWDRKSIYSEDKKNFFERMYPESGLPIENFERAWTHVMKLFDEGVVYRSMLPLLKEIEVPTLLMLGKFDDVTTSLQVRTFVHDVKLGEVVVFEKSGHFPRIDEPKLYAEQVIGFVEKWTAKVDSRRWGIVKWFKEDKGYGRIMLEGRDGDHVFVMFAEIRPDPVRFPNGFRYLKQGQKVSFELVENPMISDSQRRSAKNVQIIKEPV